MTSFILSFFIGISFGEELPVISVDLFTANKSWVWAYSEFSKQENQWLKPYLYEMYKVSSRNDSVITIEMSSSPELPVIDNPHHKFTFNYSECFNLSEVNASAPKKCFVKFYTKSLSKNWELVSSSHKPLVLTEKFNTVKSVKDDFLDFIDLIIENENKSAFKLKWSDSHYNFSNDEYAGIALLKFFDKNYKFYLL
jgi:hypothetical protein